MKIVTVQEMGELEAGAAALGLTTQVLMENAGRAVAAALRRWLGGVVQRSVVILVGPGNNGGDGLVVARHLHDWGARVRVALCQRPLTDEPNLQELRQRQVEMVDLAPGVGATLLEGWFNRCEAVLDALLGTGRARAMGGALQEALAALATARRCRPSLRLVALDLPSGLDADSGAVDPATLGADLTITLAYPKVGLFQSPGADYVGRLEIADIGMPPSLSEGIGRELLTPAAVAALLPRRPATANKGSFGRVLVVGGSPQYLGAPALACGGALRVGAGLVTLAAAWGLLPVLEEKLTETTFLPLPQAEPGVLGPQALSAEGGLAQALPSYDTLLVGCGLGQRPPTLDLVRQLLDLLSAFPRTRCIFDADALNCLARLPHWWERLPGTCVLTPHPGEMSRLTGRAIADIQRTRLDTAQEAAQRWGQVVVLKGAYTVIASPQGPLQVAPFANPGLASGGTGDVLAGAIAGLLAQGLSPGTAACGGVYLHGLAGELLRQRLGEAGGVASDLLAVLPQALRELKADTH